MQAVSRALILEAYFNSIFIRVKMRQNFISLQARQ